MAFPKLPGKFYVKTSRQSMKALVFQNGSTIKTGALLTAPHIFR